MDQDIHEKHVTGYFSKKSFSGQLTFWTYFVLKIDTAYN